MIKKIIATLTIINFMLLTLLPYEKAFAHEDIVLPPVGQILLMSHEFTPMMIKGLKIHKDDPFEFDFIIDQGQENLSEGEFKKESLKLVKYFLASLAIPEKDLWVNLSPYEKDRITSPELGVTEMGRDLLSEDYVLKQLTSSLIYPEGKIGKKFWSKVYALAEEKYNTTNVPINTFNKVWILPDKAVVYENPANQTAYVIGSKLKVMLEEDYLSLKRHTPSIHRSTQFTASKVGTDILREIIIPELTKEVNTGKNFANLRQITNSLILASWFKRSLKENILGRLYVDQKKISGVDLDDLTVKERIFQQYLRAYKRGVYNYIKEEKDPVSHELITRKYFSGGYVFEAHYETTGSLPTGGQVGPRDVTVRLNNPVKKSLKPNQAAIFYFFNNEEHAINLMTLNTKGQKKGTFLFRAALTTKGEIKISSPSLAMPVELANGREVVWQDRHDDGFKIVFKAKQIEGDPDLHLEVVNASTDRNGLISENLMTINKTATSVEGLRAGLEDVRKSYKDLLSLFDVALFDKWKESGKLNFGDINKYIENQEIQNIFDIGARIEIQHMLLNSQIDRNKGLAIIELLIYLQVLGHPYADFSFFLRDHISVQSKIFDKYEIEIIRERGKLLKEIYPRLSKGAKRALLNPTVLPVFMGVKPAYFYVPTEILPVKAEDLKSLENETIELGKEDKFKDKIDLIFWSHKSIWISHRAVRLFFRERRLLLEKGVINLVEYNEMNEWVSTLSQKGLFVNSLHLLGEIFNRTPINHPLGSALLGVLIGYPTSAIRHFYSITNNKMKNTNGNYPALEFATLITEFGGVGLISESTPEKLDLNNRYLARIVDTLYYAYAEIREIPDFIQNQELTHFQRIIDEIHLPESVLTAAGPKSLSGDMHQADAVSPGGIDLNTSNLDWQVKRDGKGIVAPIQFQNLENVHINGLSPTIIRDAPIANLSEFLGADHPVESKTPLVSF